MSRSFGGTVFTTRSPIEIVPVGDLLEPRDHPQRRRLAASRRADQDDELAVLDRRGSGRTRRSARPRRRPSTHGPARSPPYRASPWGPEEALHSTSGGGVSSNRAAEAVAPSATRERRLLRTIGRHEHVGRRSPGPGLRRRAAGPAGGARLPGRPGPRAPRSIWPCRSTSRCCSRARRAWARPRWRRSSPSCSAAG